MGKDKSTFKKIWTRFKDGKRENKDYFNAIADCIVNLWHKFICNLHIVWFNYFGAFSVVIFQFVGKYMEQKHVNNA